MLAKIPDIQKGFLDILSSFLESFPEFLDVLELFLDIQKRFLDVQKSPQHYGIDFWISKKSFLTSRILFWVSRIDFWMSNVSGSRYKKCFWMDKNHFFWAWPGLLPLSKSGQGRGRHRPWHGSWQTVGGEAVTRHILCNRRGSKAMRNKSIIVKPL